MTNVVVLIGRLAADPEMRYTPAGLAIVNFRFAVDRNKKTEQGEDQTDWFDVVCFQKTAELVQQYLDKGSLISLEGRLQSRTWEDRETGKQRSAVEVVANNVQFLESKAEAERRRAASGQALKAGGAAGNAGKAEEEDPDYVPPGVSSRAGAYDDPFGDE